MPVDEWERFIVDLVKLREYCLNPHHPRGKHKARVFQTRLGLTAEDAELLQRVLLEAAQNGQDELQATEKDPYGQRYVLDFPMTTDKGTALIRSAWIVRTDEKALRLTSCYVK